MKREKSVVLSLILYALSAAPGLCQDVFTETQLQRFVKLYVKEKELPTVDEATLAATFEQHHMTPEAYRTLKNANPEDFPESVKSLEQDLMLLQAKQDLKRESLMQVYCRSEDLSYERYAAIKQAYRTQLRFNRAMKVYFDAYWKKVNNE